MDPTALPTDNLYKFMSLAGLGIAGFCIWFRWTKVDEHNRDADDYLRRGARIVRRQKLLRKRRLDPGATRDGHDDLRIDIAELNADRDRLTENVPKVESMAHALLVGAFLSLVGSAMAFGAWYYKLQQHQDASVVDALREQKAKADLAELELKRAKAKP